MEWHLKHEEHGYKIAYDRAEYENDKRHGWIEYDFRERDKLIQAKIKAQSQTGVSTTPDAGNVGATGQTSPQTPVERVKRKYTRKSVNNVNISQ